MRYDRNSLLKIACDNVSQVCKIGKLEGCLWYNTNCILENLHTLFVEIEDKIDSKQKELLKLRNGNTKRSIVFDSSNIKKSDLLEWIKFKTDINDAYKQKILSDLKNIRNNYKKYPDLLSKYYEFLLLSSILDKPTWVLEILNSKHTKISLEEDKDLIYFLQEWKTNVEDFNRANIYREILTNLKSLIEKSE